MNDRSGVAPRLYDLLTLVGGVAPPLRLVGWDGSAAGVDGGPTVRVNSRKAVRRVLWNPSELSLARSYIAGELDTDGSLVDTLRGLVDYATTVGPRPELTAVHRREILRTAVLVGAVGPAPRAPDEERLLLGDPASTSRERSASAAGTDIFERILGPSMSYSCAYFETAEQDLDTAQTAKLDRLCQALDLKPGQRLLDLGCGWGSLLVHATKSYGVTAVGLVASAHRARVIEQRLDALGLGDRVEVRLGDYSDVEDGPYDAVAVVEAEEHVREDALVDYAARVQALLRPGGRLAQQQVTRRGDPTDAGQTFMTTYVQPEATLVPLGTLLSAYDAVGLETRWTTSLREHYPLTLLAWLERLESDWAEVVRATGETRARMWRLSLAAGLVGFERARISVHHVLAVRPFADGRSGLLLP